MSELPERIEKTIAGRALLRHAQSVLVAVSGGADSMVLLHLLHELSRKNSWRLSVAHLNHRLRGRSSDADERLVVRAARELDLPVIVERAGVKQFAREQKLSIEMAARKIRHDFLARTATRLKIRTIALAHHADDQTELFFLRLLRGSGSEGLVGMKWQNSSPANGRIKIIRPLLGEPKSALEKFAAEHKIGFRQDVTNASLDIPRNRIRHELLPLLRRHYQPALDRAVTRMMDIIGAESEFVRQFAAEWMERAEREQKKGGAHSRDALGRSFVELPVAVQRRCMRTQLLRQKIAPDFDLVESLRTRPGHLIKVSTNLAVVHEVGGCLRFELSRIVAASNLAVCELDLKAGKRGIFDCVKFDWKLQSRRTRSLPKQEVGREYFDAQKVGTRILLRHWRAGDRFQPSGMKSPVKLQDLFVNGKIPREERSSLIVAETAGGEIFWVEQLRIAERFKLSNATKHCLQWNWKRL